VNPAVVSSPTQKAPVLSAQTESTEPSKRFPK
jgi:hypothetical protein